MELPEHLRPDPKSASEWCRKGDMNLHRYQTVSDDPGCQLEVCSLCGQKTYYNKADGRIDNQKFLRDHRIDFLQRSQNSSTHKAFARAYGKK